MATTSITLPAAVREFFREQGKRGGKLRFAGKTQEEINAHTRMMTLKRQESRAAKKAAK